jgi:hypothetical protein
MTRQRSTIDLVNAHLQATLGWAKKVNTPRGDNLAMAASDLLRKASDLDEESGSKSLGEAMGLPSASAVGIGRDTIAEDVLRRSARAIATLGADADAATVASGLQAAGRVIKEHQRARQSGRPAVGLLAASLGIFTDTDGRQHDHSLAPRKWDPPRDWPCCEDLPGQVPTSWHQDDLRDLIAGVADYPAETHEITDFDSERDGAEE